MISQQQKQTIQAMLSIFETGSPYPDYGRTICTPGDAGRLSYGRAQFALSGGSLWLLIKTYCASPHAAFAESLRQWLPYLEAGDKQVDEDMGLRLLLADAAQDPVMRQTQNQLLDELYWQPAVKAAQARGFVLPLTYAAIYDGRVHGAFHKIARRTDDLRESVGDGEQTPDEQSPNEQRWCLDYLAQRQDWLSTHDNALLRRTAYRARALRQLALEGNWKLALPLAIRGWRLDARLLGHCAAEPALASRAHTPLPLLKYDKPQMQMEAVSLCRRALQAMGYRDETPEKEDVFDEGLRSCVLRFQRDYGLAADGIIGPATRAALGLV